MTSAAVSRAGEADLDVLSQVITDAFFDLAPSQWLIACPGARRRVFPGYLLVTWNPSAEGPVDRRPSSPARIPT
jgi:hypothetical protein